MSENISEAFDRALGNARNFLDRNLGLSSRKERDIEKAAQEKEASLNPEWKERYFLPNQWDDPDSWKDLEEDRRLIGPEGTYPNAAEVSGKKFDPVREPGDTGSDKEWQRKVEKGKAKEEWDRKQIAETQGLDPGDISREDMKAHAARAARKRDELFMEGYSSEPKPGETGPPVPTMETLDTGEEGFFGRTLTRARNPITGKEFGAVLAGDPEANVSFGSPRNASARQKTALKRGYRKDKAFDWPKSVKTWAGDIAGTIGIETASGIADMVLEAGDAFVPGFETVNDYFGLSEGKANLKEKIEKGVLSGEEFRERRMQGKRLEQHKAGAPERRKKWESEGYGETQIELLEQASQLGFFVKDTIEAPGRGLMLGAQVAPSLLTGMGAAQVVLVKGGAKLAKKYAKHGKNWKEHATKEEIADLNKKAKAAGIAAPVAYEAATAASQKREEVMGMSIEDLEAKSDAYNAYRDQGLSEEESKRRTADDAANFTGIANAAMVGATMGLLPIGSRLLPQKKVPGATGAKMSPKEVAEDFMAKVGVPAGKARTVAATAAGAATGQTMKGATGELGEETIQSAGQAVGENIVDQMFVDREKGLLEDTGIKTAAGALGGAMAGGAVGSLKGVGEGHRRRVERKNPQPRAEVQGTVKFRHKDQEAGTQQKLKDALANTGYDVSINSGHRTPEYNAKVGGAKKSRHTHGDAVDVNIKGWSTEAKKDFVRKLRAQGVTTVIGYKGDGMIHVDMRPGSWSAMYSTTGKGSDVSAADIDKAPAWLQEVNQEIASGQVQPGIGAPQAGLSEWYRAPRGTSAVPKTPVAREIDASIDLAAKRHSLPPIAAAYMRASTEIESSWGENIYGPVLTGTHAGDRATGPFQFTAKTAAQYGLKDRLDIRGGADAMARMYLDSYEQQRKQALKRGENLSESELWRRAAVAHHSGSHYKKLGPAGKDYLAKLDAKVNKYLTKGAIGAGGSIAAGGVEAVANTGSDWTQGATAHQAQKEGVEAGEQKTVEPSTPESNAKDYATFKETGEGANMDESAREGAIRHLEAEQQGIVRELQEMQKKGASDDEINARLGPRADAIDSEMGNLQASMGQVGEEAFEVLSSPEGTKAPNFSAAVVAAEKAMRAGKLQTADLKQITSEEARAVLEGAKAEFQLTGAPTASKLADAVSSQKLGLEGGRTGPSIREHGAKIDQALNQGNFRAAAQSLAELEYFAGNQRAKAARHQKALDIVESGGKQEEYMVQGQDPVKIRTNMERIQEEQPLMDAVVEGHLAKFNTVSEQAGREGISLDRLQKGARGVAQKKGAPPAAYQPGTAAEKPSRTVAEKPPEKPSEPSEPKPTKAEAPTETPTETSKRPPEKPPERPPEKAPETAPEEKPVATVATTKQKPGIQEGEKIPPKESTKAEALAAKYKGITNPELKARLTALGQEGHSRLNKAALIERLEAAEAAETKAEPESEPKPEVKVETAPAPKVEPEAETLPKEVQPIAAETLTVTVEGQEVNAATKLAEVNQLMSTVENLMKGRCK